MKYTVIEFAGSDIDLKSFETLLEAVEYVLNAAYRCEILKKVDYKLSVDEYK